MEFYGLLRFSEVSHFTFSDVSWTDIGFDIFIDKSKTDQTSKGNWLSIASQPGSSWCPVDLTRRYLFSFRYTSDFIMPSVKKNLPDHSSPLGIALPFAIYAPPCLLSVLIRQATANILAGGVVLPPLLPKVQLLTNWRFKVDGVRVYAMTLHEQCPLNETNVCSASNFSSFWSDIHFMFVLCFYPHNFFVI